MQCSILTTVPVHTHDHEVTCPSPSLHHIDDIMDFNVLAVYLALPPVGNLGLEPEEAIVQEDGGVGVGGAGPDDALDLESGVGAVEDEVREWWRGRPCARSPGGQSGGRSRCPGRT